MSPRRILAHIEEVFLKKLVSAINKEIKIIRQKRLLERMLYTISISIFSLFSLIFRKNAVSVQKEAELSTAQPDTSSEKDKGVPTGKLMHY